MRPPSTTTPPSAETQRLVAEAEERANAAEQRAREATEAANAHREQAAQEAEQLVSRSRREAEQIVSAAKKQADALRNSGHADSERELQALKAEVDPPDPPPRLDHRPALRAARRGRRVRRRRRELSVAVPGSGKGRPADQRRRRARGPDAPTTVRRPPQPGAPGRGGPARSTGPWSHNPFMTGFLLAAGALLAYWLGGLILQASSVLILVVVSLFLAFGLNPVVEWLIGPRRQALVRRAASSPSASSPRWRCSSLAIAPVVADQVSTLTKNAPGYFDQLQHNRQIERWTQKYDIIDKAKDYVTSGDLTQQVFGGVLGVGLAILGRPANAFIVIVLTLYFLASLDNVKHNLYRLAPASRRETVSSLGDRILDGIGGYVSGAFVVALCAGISSLVFLFIVGLGEYAVALAVVVALLDVIPMIGATLGAVIVSAIGLATDLKIGIACIIFYVVYQQVENYVIYPRVMSKSVDIPGAMTVIAALVGAACSASSARCWPSPPPPRILLLVREVFIRRQDAR